MPRGKRNVYAMFCTSDGCNRRVGTVRLLKHQPAKNRSFKDYDLSKFCSNCNARTTMKLKEEKHSS